MVTWHYVGKRYIGGYWGPDYMAEDSTAELYLPTTLRRSFSQNADSTVELEKLRTLRRSFSKNTSYGLVPLIKCPCISIFINKTTI